MICSRLDGFKYAYLLQAINLYMVKWFQVITINDDNNE